MNEIKPRTEIVLARIVSNEQVCSEHFRLVLESEGFPDAEPGQFVQVSAVDSSAGNSPLLPRAFSIGGQRAGELEILYRVIGVGTRWLSRLTRQQEVRILGPLGNCFPISQTKTGAFLVAGGVGLPPLLWLAERLALSGKSSVAFVGAQRDDLLPLSLSNEATSNSDPCEAAMQSVEFNRSGTPLVTSSDDGSVGFHGTIVEAMQKYLSVNEVAIDDTVVYSCGPNAMMQATAKLCQRMGLECLVSLERPMACGIGTCQSCIVSVEEGTQSRYALCCSEGPVFPAEKINWNSL